MPFQWTRHIGLVKIDQDGKVYLVIQNAKLSPRDTLQFVSGLSPRDALNPQHVTTTKIVKKIKSCPSSLNVFSEKDTCYLLALPNQGKSYVDAAIGIGVVKYRGTFHFVGGLAIADLDGDGIPEYFRSCTGQEGLHFTVWSGKPLIGKRRWHEYEPLEYDTEPTCQDKDYEEKK